KRGRAAGGRPSWSCGSKPGYAVTRAWRRSITPSAIRASAAATALQSGKPVKGRLPWSAPSTPPCGPPALPLPAEAVAPSTPPCCVVPVAEAPVALAPATLPATNALDVLLVPVLVEPPDREVQAADE